MQPTVATVGRTTRARTTEPYLLIILRAMLLGLVLWIFTRPGTHLQLVTVAALAAYLLWKVVRRERIVVTPLTLPIIAALGAAALATTTSIDRRLSLDGLLLVLAVAISFLLATEVAAHGWHPWTLPGAVVLVASWFVGQGIFAIISEYASWWQMRVPEYATFPVEYRLFDAGLHPNHLAALVNLALPFAILRLAQSRRMGQRALWFGWLVAADVVLFFSRSRGGWIAAAAVTTTMLLWLLEQHGAPWRVGVGAWLRRTATIWLTSGVYLGVFAALFLLVTRASASEYSTSGGSVTTGAGRTLFWSVAWQDFLRHPLTGSGPQTYAYLFMEVMPSTRTWLAAHAHNLYIDTLAQQGLVGGLALAWIVIAGVWALLRALRTVQPAMQPLLIAACAALLGVLCHSLFDVVTTLPANALLVAIVAVTALHAAGLVAQPVRDLGRWSVLALAVPVVLGLLVLRIDGAATEQQQAVDAAERNDWTAVIGDLNESVASDPSLRVYRAQRAFAYGHLALPLNGSVDDAAAQAALADYERVLSNGPDYVPHLLNAAQLYDATGDTARAEALLARAAALRSDWALPSLLLADRYASEGRAAEAGALFEQAFATEPHAREMLACRRSEACRAAADRIPVPFSTIYEAHVEGRRLLDRGRAADALAVFNRVPVALVAPQPWIDRADAHLAANQLPQARYALRMASLLGGDGPATSAQIAMTRAAYRTARAQPDDVLLSLEYSVRPGGGQPYDFFVYGRGSLPGELLPTLALLNRTVDDLPVYRALHQRYTALGRDQDAAWAAAQADAIERLVPMP